jgi:hypothetical protein
MLEQGIEHMFDTRKTYNTTPASRAEGRGFSHAHRGSVEEKDAGVPVYNDTQSNQKDAGTVFH